MGITGDSERQARLRDQSIKQAQQPGQRSRYVSAILTILQPRMTLFDIGCGTAHILHALAAKRREAVLVGLDVSRPMLTRAHANTRTLPRVHLVDGDGGTLPVRSASVDVVITRLAPYAAAEAHRVLKGGGHFVECSLGPDADQEIKAFFPERIDPESFYVPKDRTTWKQEVSADLTAVGFTVSSVTDYREATFYESAEELMDLIEMVPLVRDFDRANDRATITALAEKYGTPKGVKITWHYYVLKARKP